jgi:hypothetical protein
MTRSQFWPVLVAVTAVVIAASCAADGPPRSQTPDAVPSAIGGQPTPCGGSTEWPPNDYPPAPAGIAVELVTGMTVRIINVTQKAWTMRVAPWMNALCVGYVSAEAPRIELNVDATVERTVEDPGWGDGPLRIGIELWDHPCDDACLDQPTAFAWVDP